MFDTSTNILIPAILINDKTQNTDHYTNPMKEWQQGSYESSSKEKVFVTNQTQGSMSITTDNWFFNLLKIFCNTDKNIMASKNHRNILNH